MTVDNLSVILGVVVATLSIFGTVYMAGRQLVIIFNKFFIKPTQVNIQELTISINGLKSTIAQLITQLSTVEKRIAHIELDIENNTSKVEAISERVNRLEGIHMGDKNV